jgi:hypothetical protein
MARQTPAAWLQTRVQIAVVPQVDSLFYPVFGIDKSYILRRGRIEEKEAQARSFLSTGW